MSVFFYRGRCNTRNDSFLGIAFLSASDLFQDFNCVYYRLYLPTTLLIRLVLDTDPTIIHSISDSDTSIKMPTFLELSPEVRSMIIEEVIHADCDPRMRSSEASDYAQKFDLFRPDQKPAWTIRDLWFEAGSGNYITTAYGLMATNKQLYHETTPILQKVPIIYKVDIGFVEGRMLWPTWTSLPKKTDVVDVIQAKMQPRGPGKPCFSKFIITNSDFHFRSHEMRLRWSRLIEGLLPFIARGPQRNRENENWYEKEAVRDFSPYVGIVTLCSTVVKVLDVDFVEPDGFCLELSQTEACVHCGTNCGDLWRLEADTDYLTARDVYKRALPDLDLLTRYFSDNLFSRLFYASVGTIKIRVNGTVRFELDLDRVLIRMPNEWHNYDISPWREMAIHFKREKGLIVGESMPQEEEYDLEWEILGA